MADNYLNYTVLGYYHNRIKRTFASADDLSTLSDKVDEIIAEGGEPNTIETVKVNGTALIPDAAKAVDVTVPTATSDLTNDGDGDSNFATEAYVDANGGKIDVIKVNGVAQQISNKAVDLSIATAVSELANDSNFQTDSDVQDAIDAALSGITGIDFQVVQTLPASGVHGVIYLVPNEGATGDAYNEYIWITPSGGTAHFEKIGTTEVDLSGYWAKADLVAITTEQIDALFS